MEEEEKTCGEGILLDTGDYSTLESITERCKYFIIKHFDLALWEIRHGDSEAMAYLESEDALCLAILLGYDQEEWGKGVKRLRRGFEEKPKVKKKRKRRGKKNANVVNQQPRCS